MISNSFYGDKSSSNEFIKIKINGNDLRSNRFYYLDEFENHIFLDCVENIIYPYTSYIQLIDGRFAISYLLKPGDDFEFVYNPGQANPKSKNLERNIELQYSNVHYNKFRTTFLTKQSENQVFFEQEFINDPFKRDVLFQEKLNEEMEFLINYQMSNNLSDEFYKTQGDMIKSFYDEKYLGAVHFDFRKEYLSSIVKDREKVLKQSNLLYLNSYRNVIRFYVYILSKLNIVSYKNDGIIQGEIKDFVLSNSLFKTLKKLVDRDQIMLDQVESEINTIVSKTRKKYLLNKLLISRIGDDELFGKDQIKLFEEIEQKELTFIVFWASHNLQSIQNLNKTLNIRNQLKSKGINFIYVSIDNDLSAWKNAIETLHLDINCCFVIPNSESSRIITKFNVSEIPHCSIVRNNIIIEKEATPLNLKLGVEKLESLLN